MSLEKNISIVSVFPESFGEYIRDERMRLQVSQFDLSVLSGVSQSQISCIEHDKFTPTINSAISLVRGLIAAENNLRKHGRPRIGDASMHSGVTHER